MRGLRLSYKISSEIKAGAKWKTVYLLFKDDKCCTNILGSPGSGPLEFFWNVVNVMDQKQEGKIKTAEGIVK